ncbi:hypothetical protein DPMN_103846 [Dreissena polymorpha]|uniref:Reverse transcriptase domain-containing protein n=1 Tax=Dreissena polymorpha TaxID=45954 RepID=A0A9D4K0K7_DREPO|nr:hypothetical protein DPMN_103846 [Dreissena polymorpha]
MIRPSFANEVRTTLTDGRTDGRTDGQTDAGYTIIRPVIDGHIRTDRRTDGQTDAGYTIIRPVIDGRCPLSSSLFIICIEYLSHHIQSNTHINGISLENNEEIKQTLFADDATYFLNDNYESFHNLIESLTLFGITSGL